MTEPTLEPKGETSDSRWVSRTVLVTFCLGLLAVLGVVFTRVIAARVPQQRATLERLITERTGLEVRFDNVHFAWDLDGTSAVFEHVELTDPKAGRVHVVAPELRVEFDTWNFLRRQEFSLGHVTVRSPDIEIIPDPDQPLGQPARPARATPAPEQDEVATLRHYTAWAELMPVGRVEVLGARVHLLTRGARDARRSFTLSQAVVNRGSSTLTAYGTMLLAQDVGQSLFVSAKLEDLAPRKNVSGELRVIARRVFLEKISPALRGRGTIDARFALRDGRLESGAWTANARNLDMADGGAHFDHVSVVGALSRDASDVLVDLTDLQLTRGAKLERAPRIEARVGLEPGSIRVARTSVKAGRVPFMSGELIAGLLAPALEGGAQALPDGWSLAAGELHDVAFDATRTRGTPAIWMVGAELRNAELRRADGARLAQVSAQVRADAQSVSLTFDAEHPVQLHLASRGEPRPLALAGAVTRASDGALRFGGLRVRSGDALVAASGAWDAAHPELLTIDVQNVDRDWLGDVYALVAAPGDAAHGGIAPAPLAELASGTIVAGTLELAPAAKGIDWRHSTGKLQLASLATAATDAPRLHDAHGTLAFARGAAALTLDGGGIDDLSLTRARLDVPRDGEMRARISLSGSLASTVLRDTLRAQGLDGLAGDVTLDADVRGERKLRDPGAWRIVARVSDARAPLGGGLPAVETLAGTVRLAEGQLRTLDLRGTWLGGPVEVTAKRGAARTTPALAMNGSADASRLLRALGQEDVAQRVTGVLAWSGNAQAVSGDGWQISLDSSLAGVESRLPPPFAKARGRVLPLSAQLRVDAGGVREFVLSGRDLELRGSSRDGAFETRFDVQGVTGRFVRTAANATPRLSLDALDLVRTPATLAAAGALLPANGDLVVAIDDVHHGDQKLGALTAAFARHGANLDFDVKSTAGAPHRVALQGRCPDAQRCRASFQAASSQLATLLHGAGLPAEWPTQTLGAQGELDWSANVNLDLRDIAGRFEVEAQGAESTHTLIASAVLAGGQVELSNVQGTGPAPDQVFHGTGRVGLVARDYDLTVDYEQMALAATAMPSPARARLARAWSALRGSVAKRGLAPAADSRRVQWHGYWD